MYVDASLLLPLVKKYHTYCTGGSFSYQLVLNHHTLFPLQPLKPHTTYQHAYDTNDSPVHASTIVEPYNLTPAHITLNP